MIHYISFRSPVAYETANYSKTFTNLKQSKRRKHSGLFFFKSGIKYSSKVMWVSCFQKDDPH